MIKIKSLVYWAATAATAGSLGLAAWLYFTREPKMMAQFKKLGYPNYFPTILGVFKFLGVGALLSPGWGLLKEWAYAGFSFTFLGASASNLARRENQQAAASAASLAILAVSYLMRPRDRRAADSPRV